LISLRFRLLLLLTRWLMMQKEYCHSSLQILLHTVSSSFSLLSYRFFSSFPHGTFSLSVLYTYLDFEEGTPLFKQTLLGPFYSLTLQFINPSGLLPPLFWSAFYCNLDLSTIGYRSLLLSLATTRKISVDFFSFSYLDVSVH